MRPSSGTAAMTRHRLGILASRLAHPSQPMGRRSESGARRAEIDHAAVRVGNRHDALALLLVGGSATTFAPAARISATTTSTSTSSLSLGDRPALELLLPLAQEAPIACDPWVTHSPRATTCSASRGWRCFARAPDGASIAPGSACARSRRSSEPSRSIPTPSGAIFLSTGSVPATPSGPKATTTRATTRSLSSSRSFVRCSMSCPRGRCSTPPAAPVATPRTWPMPVAR